MSHPVPAPLYPMAGAAEAPSAADQCAKRAEVIPTSAFTRDVPRSCTDTADGRARPLTEGEDVRLDALIEEFDLEHAVRDRPWPAHQLIEPWPNQRSPALLGDLQPVRCAPPFAIQHHPERDDRARPRAQDEMDVTRMEPE